MVLYVAPFLRCNIRFCKHIITLGLDPLTTNIIEQLNLFTTAEKEILLKHLKLSNTLKSGETTTV